MDIMGPLHVTLTGRKYALVMIDLLTRYVEVFALRDQMVNTIAKVFVTKIIMRYGCPRQLLTGRGTNFISQLMKEVCTLFGAKQVQTTAYHSQANGAIGAIQNYWDQLIPYVVFAYNTTSHTSTGETPFFLMYGRDPEIPMEDILVLKEDFLFSG